MKNILMILAFVFFASCNNSNSKSDKSPNNVNTEKNYLSTIEYIDPKGFFSIFPPAGWNIKEFPEDLRGKIHFIKSSNNHLMILAKAIPQQSLDELYKYCLNEGRDKLKSMGANDLTIDTLKYGVYEVIERRFTNQGSKSIMVDYFIEGVNHNLFYTAPQNEFDDYIKIVKSSILTYNPRLKIITKEDQKFHNLQSRRRVAKLLYDMGDYEQANAFIQDGLEISPNDSILNDIQSKINLKIKL